MIFVRFIEGAAEVLQKKRNNQYDRCALQIICFGYYFATLSSHFTMLNITSIESPVAITNTNQHAQIGTLV